MHIDEELMDYDEYHGKVFLYTVVVMGVTTTQILLFVKQVSFQWKNPDFLFSGTLISYFQEP